jgi:hypothetical protein
MKCPSFERLIDYLDSRLSDSEAAVIAGHLASNCVDCADNRSWYQHVRSVAAADDTVEPPMWVTRRAFKIPTTQRRRSIASSVGQIIASLVFDSFQRPALAGVRSTETANRQLLYKAGDYSVDLQIALSENGGGNLNGQVLKEGDPTFEAVSGLQLQVTRDDETMFSAVTNQMGEFKVSGMDQGQYGLRVELPDGHITVPDFPVSES